MAPCARTQSGAAAERQLCPARGRRPSRRPRARSRRGEAARPARLGAHRARRRERTRSGARRRRVPARARPRGAARIRCRARVSTRDARAVRSTRCSSLEPAGRRTAQRPALQTSAGAKQLYERNARGARLRRRLGGRPGFARAPVNPGRRCERARVFSVELQRDRRRRTALFSSGTSLVAGSVPAYEARTLPSTAQSPCNRLLLGYRARDRPRSRELLPFIGTPRS